MRTFSAAAVATAALLAVGAGQALGSPADEGNCISNRDNGGAAGARISAAAGPGFGAAVAGGIGGGVIGSTAGSPDCRRAAPGT